MRVQTLLQHIMEPWLTAWKMNRLRPSGRTSLDLPCSPVAALWSSAVHLVDSGAAKGWSDQISAPTFCASCARVFFGRPSPKAATLTSAFLVFVSFAVRLVYQGAFRSPFWFCTSLRVSHRLRITQEGQESLHVYSANIYTSQQHALTLWDVEPSFSFSSSQASRGSARRGAFAFSSMLVSSAQAHEKIVHLSVNQLRSCDT